MTEARIVIGLAVVAVMVTVLVYLAQRLRRIATQTMPGAVDYLGEFREMKEQGAIDDEEFSRLRTTLSEQAVKESKNEDADDSEGS